MKTFKPGDIVTPNKEIRLNAFSGNRRREYILEPGHGFPVIAVFKDIEGSILCLLNLGDFAKTINVHYLELVSRASTTEDVTRICWNDMTDKEKSDFLFMLSHQKSAAKPVSDDLNTYADEYAASTIQMMKIAGEDDDNSFEEYIKQACIDAANWQKQRIMTLLSAEKENTGIGLCEYDAGNENGRMEVINSLTDKIKTL